MLSLIPSFGSAALTLIAFVAALSVIVFVHEYGHYIVGRWSGIHAEVFSLGFGPVLWSRMDKRGTRWQLAALPFGGYVKFLGDANAASGKDAEAISRLAPEDQRHTMHGAPLWARAATVAAGPMANFLFSTLVFLVFAMAWGVPTTAPVVGAVKPMPAFADSLQAGDRITALAGTETPDLAAFIAAAQALPPAPSADYAIERDGNALTVEGPYPFPPVVDGVQPQSAAMDAGIQVGDVVTHIDGTPIWAFEQLRSAIGASEGKTVTLTVWRDGTTEELALTPRRADLPTADGGFETRWLIGLTGGLVIEPETRTPNPWEALKLGVSQTWALITTTLSGLWHMVTGAISTCNLQGPIGIAETSADAASQGGASFVWFIAMLSTAVGLMNLFPIPVLDGGHLVFHAWEAVTGHPPTERALRALMAVGLSILLTLMLFALGNDLLFCR